MKLLLMKLSSLGDLLHVFPVLTALQQQVPNLEVTWVVESGFAEVPLWHPAVKQVILAPFRQIKKEGFGLAAVKKIWTLIRALRQEQYDYVIDAQGLFKSAILAKFARGQLVGFGKGSSREKVSWFYRQKVSASWDWHAIQRIEALFKVIKPIDLNLQTLDYGLPLWKKNNNKTAFFAHGTTWTSKHYPDILWQELVGLVTAAGWQVWLPHSNSKELKRTEFLKINDKVEVLPKISLSAIKDKLYEVDVMVSVDTGLAHIAAAIGLPNITLYGPTDPKAIGTVGQNQQHVTARFECAPCRKKSCFHPDRFIEPSPPCFRMVSPQQVLQMILQIKK